MALTQVQKELNDRRIKEQQHDNYQVNIPINPELNLKNFWVYKNVLRPEKSSGWYLAKFLSQQKKLFLNKKIIDMGCGSGIQGIIVGLMGAKEIIFSDITKDAVNNTQKNIIQYDLANVSKVYQGDLFSSIPLTKADIIIFNHPFFDERVIEQEPITIAFYDEGKIIHRFLFDVKEYLKKDGFIFMPFFEFAGTTNNPLIQAPEHGFNVEIVHDIEINDHNIQKGRFMMFKIFL